MHERETQFAATLAALLEDPHAESDRHLTPDILVAYHHGGLTPEEADAAQEHLAACRECGDFLLELVRFGDEEEEGVPDEEGVSDFEQEAAWRELRGRLGEVDETGDPSTGAPVRPPAVRPASRPAALRFAYGLAATFLLTSLGLGFWVARLLDERQEPQPNTTIVTLKGEGITRGDPEDVQVRGLGERFVVVLNPPVSYRVEAAHDVEIRDGDDHLLEVVGGLWPTDIGTFQLSLSRRRLAPGTYHLRLLLEGKLVEEFELPVMPPNR